MSNPAALEFLLTRRSRPYKILSAPAPDRDALEPLLRAAARVPDHGKLEPWRFIVLSGAAMTRLATQVVAHGQAIGKDADEIEKMRFQLASAPLAVAVVASPKPSAKIPAIEQSYSAGAVCLSLLNATLAAGWGANWLSGWASHDAQFLQDTLGIRAPETLAGFVHVGTATATPPERPRPDLEAITTWVDA